MEAHTSPAIRSEATTQIVDRERSTFSSFAMDAGFTPYIQNNPYDVKVILFTGLRSLAVRRIRGSGCPPPDHARVLPLHQREGIVAERKL